jgi:hypothetical protein
MSQPVGFTCPRCGMTSYNPNDRTQGYCGNCHAWTREEAEAPMNHYRMPEPLLVRARQAWCRWVWCRIRGHKPMRKFTGTIPCVRHD